MLGHLSFRSLLLSSRHPADDPYESLSDGSEEEDCKIVGSHPRTFSVPSSGDDRDDSDSDSDFDSDSDDVVVIDDGDDDDDDDMALYTSRSIGSAPGNDSNHHRTYGVGDTLTQVDFLEQSTRADSLAESAILHPIELEELPPEFNRIMNGSRDARLIDDEQQTGARVGKHTDTNKDDVKALAPHTVIPDTYASFETSRQTSVPHQVGGDGGDGVRGIVQHEVPTDATLDRNRVGRREDTQEHQDISSVVDPHSKEATGPMCDNPILATESVHEHLRKPLGAVDVGFDQHRSALEWKRWQESPLLQKVHADTHPNREDSMTNGSQSPEASPAKEYTTEDKSDYDNDEDRIFVEPALVQKDPVPSTAIQIAERWSQESPVSSHPPPGSPFVPHFLARANAIRSTHPTQPKPAEISPDREFDNVTSPRSFWLEPQPKTMRAPSPSDAALARNVPSMQAECHNPFVYDDHVQGFPSHPLQPLRRPAIVPGIGDHQIPSQGYILAPARHDKTFNSQSRADHLTPPSYTAQSWNGGWLTDRIQALPAEHAEPNEYDQGPFSRNYESFHSVAIPQVSSRQSSSPPPQKSCLVRLKLDPKNVDGQSDQSHHILDPSSSSKVDISNLVNPHADGARNLKRKSSQISANEMVNGIADGISRDQSEQPSSEDDLGPHAQARDTSIAVNDTISQQLVDDLTHAPTSAVADAAEEGPVRKKTKLSTPKAGSVGKFVSGVCLGLAGAFAAFLAATPSDVWDEALRETIKLV
ncbi:MAG: hypothetical protein Q9223_003479 [Gallowayella weberi]